MEGKDGHILSFHAHKHPAPDHDEAERNFDNKEKEIKERIAMLLRWKSSDDPDLGESEREEYKYQVENFRKLSQGVAVEAEIKERYAGWTKGDFVRILREIGEEFPRTFE
ncbi:MAG: hypothetical protein WCT29_02165 [Candidatus Paceibacterota bacterium]|jgi:hypothetical protein